MPAAELSRKAREYAKHHTGLPAIDLVESVLADLGPSTQPEIRAACGLGSDNVKGALSRLRSEGRINRTGRSRSFVYSLRRPMPADPVQPKERAPDPEAIWQIGANGDLVLTSETGERLYIPRNKIAKLLEFAERTRTLWDRP
jgi:hypothetical protein